MLVYCAPQKTAYISLIGWGGDGNVAVGPDNLGAWTFVATETYRFSWWG